MRICGDYKVTLNQVLDVDQNPLPEPSNLFATLAGGKVFSKLDLTQAYHQMEVEEKFQHFLTITAHKGLYHYRRLPFGISSAPALFQRTMEQILQGIPGVVAFMDDRELTGATVEEHLGRLDQVLQRAIGARPQTAEVQVRVPEGPGGVPRSHYRQGRTTPCVGKSESNH